MNMIESTVAMIKTLPEANLIKVQKFTKKLILKNEDRLIDDAVGNFYLRKAQKTFTMILKFLANRLKMASTRRLASLSLK